MSSSLIVRRTELARILLFNKPHGVLTQFRAVAGRTTLADYIAVPGVYPAGRLDADSEGLLVLTDDGAMQAHISHPRHKQAKTYWAQVEGCADEAALMALRQGLDLGDFHTRPCQARVMAEPAQLWPRDPPIRHRETVPTSWLEIVIAEGKNRQVRRMTAKVGLPTLRLIRWAVGGWTLADLAPGTWRELSAQEMRGLSPSVHRSNHVNAEGRRRVTRADAAIRGMSKKSSAR